MGAVHPYPTILVFGNNDTQIAISIADKRINQADKTKWVLENSWVTPWFDPTSLNDIQQAFVADCAMARMPFTNFLAFYEASCNRVIAFIVAERTGSYILGTSALTARRIAHLQEMTRRDHKIAMLKTRLKKTTQMAQKITLNTEIKQHKDAIIECISQIRNEES